MGWLREELWLDTDVLWFREAAAGPSTSFALHAPSFFGLPAAAAAAPAPTGLAASRQRRAERERRRQRTRTVPAVALAVGSTAMIPFVAQRQAAAPGVLQEDPPSLTFRLGLPTLEAPIPRRPGVQAEGGQPRKTEAGTKPQAAANAEPVAEPPASTQEFEQIRWQSASSTGLPYAGRLSNGTQLPLEGPDWVTWNPVTDSSPNRPGRLHGNEQTIRKLVDVLTAHRAAFPDAPRVVVGDISFEGGGPMNEHLSHQNGLDVDVYYPRLDRELRAPTSASQVDHVLAQDLLDRFLAAGAQMVFVGYSTGLQGPGGVVVPWPNHENHMHVRFRRPAD